MKRLITAAMIVLGTAIVLPLQASAQVRINIFVNEAPPAPRYEVVPAPRRGYAWTPGYWNWNGQRHVWQQGQWVRARAGQQYQRTEWYRENDGWRLRKGGWKEEKKRAKQERKEEKRQAKYDRDDRDDRDHRDNRGHCPPGHAKKGEC
jgi:hypothetical protein